MSVKFTLLIYNYNNNNNNNYKNNLYAYYSYIISMYI